MFPRRCFQVYIHDNGMLKDCQVVLIFIACRLDRISERKNLFSSNKVVAVKNEKSLRNPVETMMQTYLKNCGRSLGKRTQLSSLHSVCQKENRPLYCCKRIGIVFAHFYMDSFVSLHRKAVALLDVVLQDLFTYMQFSKQHWPSNRSTNVIKSIFAIVKLRTNIIKRIPPQEYN